ncbi:hypothetical protein M6D93_05035 [Jatrophihabitans telluris]|uniref:Uncharacterized protein n=1 Tax=Jatrophihabitans telluris TaxID=2038343 RepID=A0ABY4R2K5_9ACTN|nr:hypothetical protein [Jatrophihabitans telluris]UQX89370.1 hypothetical protein M6D93_05035 [Jatrophihabitans telluris]
MLAGAPPALAAGTVPPTTAIQPAIPFDQTNGDILAVTKVVGSAVPLIAFGGNFTAVITPDGLSHAATNFAVVDETTGTVVYAGNANSYVRTISSYAGVIYVGGDFTTFGGLVRNRLAALGTTFSVTSWAPSSSVEISAVTATSRGVYYGGASAGIHLANFATGADIWQRYISGGPCKVISESPDGASVYIGGLFETYNGLARHGLAKASAVTGVVDPAFNANFRVDSGVGVHASFDGEEAISLAWDGGTKLVVGVGGYGADEIRQLNPLTGVSNWMKFTPGDVQGTAVVGDTYIAGYHRNQANASIPYPNFGAQVEATNGQLTSWDPLLTGNQANADHGNNGIQAVYADPVAKKLFIAGAFLKYGTVSRQSLIVFPYS